MFELREPLFDKEQTVKNIRYLVNNFHDDLDSILIEPELIPIHKAPLNRFFSFVKNIPYRKDTKPVEVISRPYYIIKHKDLGMDCKKKAILIASYAECNDIDYRFIASSSRPDKKIHHIFVQFKIGNVWKNVDATYSHYKLFAVKNNLTYSEIL